MINTNSIKKIKASNFDNLFQNTTIGIISVITFSCLSMYVLDVYIPLEYFQKSLIKIVLFALIPISYCLYYKHINLKDFLKINSKKQIIFSLLFGAMVYVFIIFAFIIFKDFIDLDSISSTLSSDLNVSGKNFIFVAFYISFINSFLEEFFFRGFSFFTLEKLVSRRFAYVFCSLIFSLYHVAIILSWFNIFIFTLILIALFVAGAIFHWLNSKNTNIYNSWLVHMFANFAINSVGIYMFYF